MEDPLGIVGTRLDGRYTVERAVAEGGFGVVYRAAHEALGCPVAVKVLRPADAAHPDADRVTEALSHEARTLAALSHPAVVRAMDFGVSTLPSGERAAWMVMEWLDGETLAARLAARGGRGASPAEALALLRPAIDAVAHAHARGVVHRDLKPSNLMCMEGPVPLRVLDFGIARAMRPDDLAPPSGETRSRSARRFSPAYAAPEQVGGTRTGPWTDVHALGLILTEVLTGAEPYRYVADDDPSLGLFLAVLSDERPTPAARGVNVGAWEPVLLRALALRPGERFPDAGALLAALEDALPDARSVARRAPAPSISSRAPAAYAATEESDPTPAPPPRRRSLAPWVAFAALSTAAVVGLSSRASTTPPVAAAPRAATPPSPAPASPALAPEVAAPAPAPRPPEVVVAAPPVVDARVAPRRAPARHPARRAVASPAPVPAPPSHGAVTLAPAE